MRDPVVPEKNRRCGSCGNPVGRSRNGRPGRTEGFCPHCGTAYSFSPKLEPSEWVAGQYEVLGCLAHGGLGWIYLARDRNVSDRWVVLKGLLNTGDAEAHQAAAAERSFLAEVEHPNIVKIYNFVQHPDPTTGVPTGYIVMEYVGGRSLKELLVQRREEGAGDEVLPVHQVIAYGLEVLRALGYLHSKGLLFCDFKPDNVIQSEEQVKLIDLGGVRKVDDYASAIYATPGYRVPEEELREIGPSVSGDLYTVGRTLAVLSFNFPWSRKHQNSLPERESAPLLVRYESYDRFLRRATHNSPERRFADADDMAEQLTGVLREILADMDGQPRPAASGLFGPEHFIAATGKSVAEEADRLLFPPAPDVAAAGLPVPLVDPEDPAAGLLSGLTGVGSPQVVASLEMVASHTPETRLMLARSLIALGRSEQAAERLDEAAEHLPGDWRVVWYRALLALRDGEYAGARVQFDELYDFLPGEAAPKLALGVCCEGEGRLAEAGRYYGTVWRTDHAYVSAAFGLARTLLAQGDRAAAVRALDTVPALSSLHPAAQQAAVAALAGGGGDADLTEVDLVDAGARLERLGLRGEARGRIAAQVLKAALDWTKDGRFSAADTTLLGSPLTEEGLRENLERTYRELARFAEEAGERRALIDAANEIRPRTWV